jgi:hypothetical protein
MSCLKTWEMKCHKKGDTRKANVLTFPFDITGMTFLMQFRLSEIGINNNPVAFEWSSADGSFEITEVGAIESKLLMKKQLIEVEQGFYVSDLQMTQPNGDVETYFNVEISIVEDYSRTT